MPISRSELRVATRAQRRAVSPEEAKAAGSGLLDRLREIPELAQAGRIAAYVSVRDELSTRDLLASWLAEGREIGVPRVVGETLEMAPIRDLSDLSPGAFGIPTSLAPAWETFDAAIVPGLAFTPRGDRLGYGKGHYDRLLSVHPGVFTVGVSYDFQIAEEFPTEPHDVRMSAVATPSRIHRAG